MFSRDISEAQKIEGNSDAIQRLKTSSIEFFFLKKDAEPYNFIPCQKHFNDSKWAAFEI